MLGQPVLYSLWPSQLKVCCLGPKMVQNYSEFSSHLSLSYLLGSHTP